MTSQINPISNLPQSKNTISTNTKDNSYGRFGSGKVQSLPNINQTENDKNNRMPSNIRASNYNYQLQQCRNEQLNMNNMLQLNGTLTSIVNVSNCGLTNTNRSVSEMSPQSILLRTTNREDQNTQLILYVLNNKDWDHDMTSRLFQKEQKQLPLHLLFIN